MKSTLSLLTAAIVGNVLTAQAFEWRLATSTQPPTAREGHSITWIPNNRSAVMFGGSIVSAPNVLNDMWSWDGAAWTSVSQGATLPSARSGHSASYDLIRRRLVVFGGQAGNGAANNQTWEWDGAAWTQMAPTTSPSARTKAGMTYGLGQTVMFGGQPDGSGAGTYSGETWTWNGINWTLRSVTTAPSARTGSAMVFDSIANDVKLFGGNTTAPSGGEQNDLWSWNGSTWSLIPAITRPTARRLHQMAFDRARNRLVVFGGINGVSTNLSDTWSYTPTTGWSQVSSTASPAVSRNAAMAYDEIREEVILHGGYQATVGNVSSQTWVSPGGYTQTFGTGCAGAAGTPALSATGRPVFSSSFQYQTASTPSNALCCMIIGFQNSTWNTLPLPFNLAQLGFPAGCSLLVDNVTSQIGLANAGGIASFALTLPSANGLFSLPLYMQCAVADSTRTSQLQFVWSNGMLARIGF